MEKILVRWCDGRSSGTTSLVKKTAVKKGTIAVGKRVTVAWGKSKKTYQAEVVSATPRHQYHPQPPGSKKKYLLLNWQLQLLSLHGLRQVTECLRRTASHTTSSYWPSCKKLSPCRMQSRVWKRDCCAALMCWREK